MRTDESELMRLCARTRLDSATEDRIRQLAGRPIDWPWFVKYCDRHSVLALVASNLSTIERLPLPNNVSSMLRQKSQGQAFWNMTLSNQLLNLLQALSTASIPAITFKGAALAQIAYGSLALRRFDDLDILIRPSDAQATVRILETFGYPGWDPNQPLSQHLDGECEETFIHPNGGAIVDLHWALSRGYLPFPVSFQTLMKRSQSVRLGTTDVSTLGTEDLVLFLCLHGAKHRWERLGWVCDVAELIRARQVDMDAMLRRATKMGNRRVVLVAMELARTILDAPMDERTRRAISSDPGARAIARELRENLLAVEGVARNDSVMAERVNMTLFHLRMYERLRDRIRYLMEAAVPNPRDRGVALALPRPMHGLYFIIRPIRLLLRYGLYRFAAQSQR